MVHFIKLHVFDIAGHFWIGQLASGFNNPAIGQRRVRVEYLGQHTERPFAKGIQDYTHCLFGRDFFVGAGVTFDKMISTFFALVSLLPASKSSLDDVLRLAVLARWHIQHPFDLDAYIISH
jgi:hypothetical protein